LQGTGTCEKKETGRWGKLLGFSLPLPLEGYRFSLCLFFFCRRLSAISWWRFMCPMFVMRCWSRSVSLAELHLRVSGA
jgi:hypothetical protein